MSPSEKCRSSITWQNCSSPEMCIRDSIGKVGYDPWGDMGDQWMSDSGVDTTYMYRDHSVSTGTGLIMVDEDGLNTIVDGDSACSALTWDETHAAIEAMKEAKVFITGFGMPYRKALDGAKIAKEEFGMTTLCNASPLQMCIRDRSRSAPITHSRPV